MGPLADHVYTLWRDWLHAGADDVGHAAFWLEALQIVFINLLLSGDNAVIIAMACRGLPAQQRRWGIAAGAGVAVILRIILVSVVEQLLLLPYFKLAGGLALVLIAAKLIVPEPDERDDIHAAAHLWRVVMIVAAADIVMSVDNVIAIVAAARGDLLLLVVGIAVSVPMIMAGAALIVALIDRFPFLVWAGAALLGWLGGDTLATDPAVVRFTAGFDNGIPQHTAFAAGGAAMLLAVGIGGIWRSSYLKAQAAASERIAV